LIRPRQEGFWWHLAEPPIEIALKGREIDERIWFAAADAQANGIFLVKATYYPSL
jgi:hypothetical protein